MHSNQRVLFRVLFISCLLSAPSSALASQVKFIIDPSGTANGLVGLAPTAANA
jgi:hypothetical protein